MPILKLESHDAERELAFELDFQLSLTFEERWRMMIEESDRIANMLIENGQRKPTALIKRP